MLASRCFDIALATKLSQHEERSGIIGTVLTIDRGLVAHPRSSCYSFVHWIAILSLIHGFRIVHITVLPPFKCHSSLQRCCSLYSRALPRSYVPCPKALFPKLIHSSPDEVLPLSSPANLGVGLQQLDSQGHRWRKAA